MPDIGTHGNIATAVVVVAYVGGIDAYPWFTPLAVAGFVIGSITPDVGDLGYKFEEKRQGRKHSLWGDGWSQKQFDKMDEYSWFAVTYRVTHSLLFSILLNYYMVAFLFGPTFALGHFVGNCKHYLLDLPTHTKTWLFWPLPLFPIRIPVEDWYAKSTVKEYLGEKTLKPYVMVSLVVQASLCLSCILWGLRTMFI